MKGPRRGLTTHFLLLAQRRLGPITGAVRELRVGVHVSHLLLVLVLVLIVALCVLAVGCVPDRECIGIEAYLENRGPILQIYPGVVTVIVFEYSPPIVIELDKFTGWQPYNGSGSYMDLVRRFHYLHQRQQDLLDTAEPLSHTGLDDPHQSTVR